MLNRILVKIFDYVDIFEMVVAMAAQWSELREIKKLKLSVKNKIKIIISSVNFLNF